MIKLFTIVVSFLFLFFFVLHSFSQNISGKSGGSISGNLIDSISQTSIEYATISVFEKGSKKPLNGVITDQKGNFVLSGLKLGISYKIQVDFLGFRTLIIDGINLSQQKSNIPLGILKLSSQSKTIRGVTVRAQKELIENRIDKLVYNAEKDLTSQSGVVTDILKKIPQISVDIDGNVELAGSSSIRFLINGKPSTAFGSSITDVLQSIPANQIKSIEVITNPSAKYDGQGLGGIINIILKTNTAQGINGSLSLTGGTRNENGAFNFNYRKGKLGINAFFSGNYRPEFEQQNISDQLEIIDSSVQQSKLHQQGSSRVHRGGLESGIEFDFEPDPKDNLTGSIDYDVFERRSSSETHQFTYTSPINLLNDTLSKMDVQDNALNSFNFHNVDLNFDWKRKFKKEDEELELSITSSFGKGNSIAQNQLYHLPYSLPIRPFFGDSSQNPGKDQETEISLDYSNPIKKDVVWAYGAKVDLRNVKSDLLANSYDTLTNLYSTNTVLSNQLTYHQQVYALYSEISFPFGEILEFKAGLRYQRTALGTVFSNALGLPSPPGYNSFFPSVFFSKKLNNHNQLFKLSFSRRLEPPDYRDLDPYINVTDPNNLTRGNPYLLPETADRLEFGYSTTYEKVGSFAFTAFYKTSNNDIQPYSVLYPSFTVGNVVYKNVNVITSQNVGFEEDLGFNIFANFHLTDRWEARSNTTLFHRYTTNYINRGLNAQSWNYRININVNYTLENNFNAEFSGNFNSARNEVQGHFPSFTSYLLGLRKSFWKQKGSLAFIAGNFLNKNITQTSSISGINFSTQSERIIPFRTFGLNFNWKFGNLKFKKSKEDGDHDKDIPKADSSPDGGQK